MHKSCFGTITILYVHYYLQKMLSLYLEFFDGYFFDCCVAGKSYIGYIFSVYNYSVSEDSTFLKIMRLRAS